MDYKKGFTLLTALLMVLFVSLAMAVIGTALLKSTQIGHGIKVFKTTKEAAETTAYAVIKKIDSLPPCTPTSTKGSCSFYDHDCEITDKVIPDVKEIVEKSSNIEEVNAYLISNCTEGTSHIYTIEVKATAKNGATTTIYFIYKK
jgi:hypothetical protein